MAFEIILIVLSIVLAATLQHYARKASKLKHKLDIAEDQLENVINQFAHKGSPLRKWDRPKKHNKADEFYWLVRIAGEDYLFTDEAIQVAVSSADKMRERGFLHD